MNPDDFMTNQQRLGFNGGSPGRSMLGTALAVVAGTTMLVLGFMFSVVIIAVAVLAGIIGFGYLWWKSRALRSQLKAQMELHARQAATPSYAATKASPAEGEIIEGVVIREEREIRK